MLKLAIVSSYSESCGNAAFTKVLHDSIEDHSHVQVTVIELNLRLLQSANKVVRRLGDSHIKDICKTLRNFDAVNLQIESGLYGSIPNDIVKRIKALIDSNSNTSLTLHAPRLIPSSMHFRTGIKKILSLHILSGVKEVLSSLVSDVNIKINKKIIRHAIKRKKHLIVHTLRAREQIKQHFSYENIDVHPLKIVSESFIADHKKSIDIRKDLDLTSSDILIGMFGYISAYKGHADALKAITYLPNNYKMLIFGRQHPQTLKTDGIVDSYLDSLLKIIEDKPTLKERVFFLGELSEQDFIQMASNIDIAWLPYYENGQDGSGIASICLDVCGRVLCSNSFAFDELFKLLPYKNYMRFDIGNTMELANKTKMFLKKQPCIYYTHGKYNISSQVEIYIKNLTKLSLTSLLIPAKVDSKKCKNTLPKT